MNLLRTIPAIACFGVLMIGVPASGLTQEPWLEVRQALYDNCEKFTGHARGICMQSAAQSMRIYSEESSALYEACRAAGNSPTACDEEREIYWRSKLLY